MRALEVRVYWCDTLLRIDHLSPPRTPEPVDGLRYETSIVELPRRFPPPTVAPRVVRALIAAAVLHAAFIYALFAAAVPLGTTDEWVLHDRRYVFRQVTSGTFADPEEPSEMPAYHPQADYSHPGTDAMGLPYPHDEHRYGIEGAPDNADPHVAIDNGVGTSRMEPTAPWGRPDSSGLDEMSAAGALWGEELGRAQGQAKTVGVGGLNDHA